MRSTHSNPFRSALPVLAMILALCLIGTGQASAQALTTSQQAAVTNLSAASGAIKTQLALGTAFSAGFAAAASNGTIVDPTAYQRATISNEQRAAYNAALGTFGTADFYTAKQMLQQQAAVATANMQTAISALAMATVDLQKTATVNQMLQTVSDAPTAKSTQSAIAASGLGTEVTSSQVSAYNTSLANVNSYASQAATFFKAANSVTLTTNIDNFKAQYNKDLTAAYVSAGYNSGNPYVTVSWQDGLSLGQAGALSAYTQSSQSFYAANNPFGGN